MLETLHRGTGWASVEDLPPEFLDDMLLAEEALGYANFILWSLSGRRYNDIVVTTESYDTRHVLSAGNAVYPVLQNGAFYNVSSCSKCSCEGCGVFHRIRLRGYPVRYIVDVWVAGYRVPREDYVILDNSVLGFMNPRFCGASCITVEYAYGTGVPPGGKLAAVKLATELLLARRGEQCRLPERVTSISRQGMSWTLLDPQDFLKDGRTGIYEIDLLLKALNPAGALARPRVFSVDLPRASTYTMPDPPPSVVLQGGDQMVVPGEPMRWVTSEPALLDALYQGWALTTRFTDGNVKDGGWQLMPDMSAAYVDFSGGETRLLACNVSYEVIGGGQVLLAGEVRSFS